MKNRSETKQNSEVLQEDAAGYEPFLYICSCTNPRPATLMLDGDGKLRLWVVAGHMTSS